MFAAFSVSEFTEHADVAILLLVLYCFASLPFVYLLSFLFSVPSTALVRITLFFVITGFASSLTITVLRFLGKNVGDKYLHWFFLSLPPYCLGKGLADVYTNDQLLKVCTKDMFTKMACARFNLTYQTNFFSWESPGVGTFLVALPIQGVVCFAILFMIEFNIFRVLKNRVKSNWFALDWISYFLNGIHGNIISAETQEENIDEDVAREVMRVGQLDVTQLTSSNQLLLTNLRKIYGRSFVAVQNLSVGISKGECFGLLGTNGAGKTTTFKMLTGDLQPTAGTAYVDGYDITYQLRQAQQRMGYCPQFDGLIEQMTGTETLRMFARLRGVKEANISTCIKNLGHMLHFATHLDKECGKYSGGNKRKLSTAIALIGDPPVVLLDEPSTGMDPGARRLLWDALSSVRTSGRSIILTSHSMEECEALCTRLAIMVNGRLRCLGGPQHLKNKFGQGYTVEIKAEGSAAKAVMKKYFPESELKDEHHDILTYNIPEVEGGSLNLSTVFYLMEQAKSEAKFEKYTVTQTSLEQVFLRLVRWQKEANN